MTDSPEPAGIIFNMQKFSLHDGPGIRTLVFMKGCPLACLWCSNPESMASDPEVSFKPEYCLGLNQCEAFCQQVCPEAAFYQKNGVMYPSFEQCRGCGACAAACPGQALHCFGKAYTVKEVMQVVLEDAHFFRRGGGGLTVGGGEPLLQADFVTTLLAEARRHLLDTAIETCGQVEFARLFKVAGLCDHIFYDIKHYDSQKHKQYTGVDNRLIIKNITQLAEEAPRIPVTLRTPVVPGYTDDEQNIIAIARLAAGLKNVVDYELLPYHSFGSSKYKNLGRVYPLQNVPAAGEKLAELQTLVRKNFSRKW